MNGWIKVAALLAVAAIVAGLSGGAGATNAPSRATKASSNATVRSAENLLAARRGALLRHASLTTVAGATRYLRAIGVNPRGVVIQRGPRNYAGPSCPGAGWTCTSTAHPVVQVARPGGRNMFVCRSATCAVVQTATTTSRRGRALTAAAATKSGATCIKTTGVTQSCSISQTGATSDNSALVYEDVAKLSGLTQSAVYSAQITQQQAMGSSGGNTACVHQNVGLDGSTTAKNGQPVNVNIQSHESITITQDAITGANTVLNAINPSNGVYTCDASGSALTQSESLNSVANGATSITQNLDQPAGGPNLKLDIEQNQSVGYKNNNAVIGVNIAKSNQSTALTAIAATSAGPVSQTESSAPDGGIVAMVNQWSHKLPDLSNVSTIVTAQSETQCEHAQTTPTTTCAAGGTLPANTTQKQFGPIASGGHARNTARRTLAKTGKDSSVQADNPNDTFSVSQTTTQQKDTNAANTQQNIQTATCTTTGTCTGNSTLNNNNNNVQNGNGGTGNVTFDTNCTTNCQTTANFPSGNILVSVGNGKVQMWNRTGTTLLHTFDTGTASFTTGSAFDSAKNFYVTDFGANTVSKFNSDGTLAGSFGSGYNASPESIVFDGSGNAFVGQADGSHEVLKFSPTGTPITSFAPAIENRGTDWIDLASDGCTLYYTSEGTSVKRFDVCANAQLGDFATGLPGTDAFAIKLLPGGGALVADWQSIVRLDATGAVVQQYGQSPTAVWFSLALDPSGSSFWAGDEQSGQVTKFDLSTGNTLATFNTGLGADAADGLAISP